MTTTSQLRRFTADDARTLTEAEVMAFWVARQRAMRDAGREHFESLVDLATDTVVATI